MSAEDSRSSPLSGLRVLVTRPEGSAASWCDALRRAGAIPIHRPLLRPEALPGEDLRTRLAAPVDWMVLTSAEAVRQLDCFKVGGDVRCVCVGEATGKAARERGLRVVSLRGTVHDGRSLAQVMAAELELEGARVVFPCAEAASDSLPRALEDAGARVERFHLYRSAPVEFDPEEMAEVIAGCEALTFASPSAVESLVQGLGERAGTILSTPICLAIGETTASALRRQGLSADVIAKAPDAEGMIEALAAHFGSSSSAPED